MQIIFTIFCFYDLFYCLYETEQHIIGYIGYSMCIKQKTNGESLRFNNNYR